LAETASGLALAAKREVFVYEYRGYASESTVHPTAAAIQETSTQSSIAFLNAAGAVS
jgi:hypothetical protein